MFKCSWTAHVTLLLCIFSTWQHTQRESDFIICDKALAGKVASRLTKQCDHYWLEARAWNSAWMYLGIFQTIMFTSAKCTDSMDINQVAIIWRTHWIYEITHLSKDGKKNESDIQLLRVVTTKVLQFAFSHESGVAQNLFRHSCFSNPNKTYSSNHAFPFTFTLVSHAMA